MKLEGTIHCEGPDCESHAHVGADTMEAERLPIGFVKLIWYGGNGRDSLHGFCSMDCAMKFAAKFDPPEIIPLYGDGDVEAA